MSDPIQMNLHPNHAKSQQRQSVNSASILPSSCSSVDVYTMGVALGVDEHHDHSYPNNNISHDDVGFVDVYTVSDDDNIVDCAGGEGVFGVGVGVYDSSTSNAAGIVYGGADDATVHKRNCGTSINSNKNTGSYSARITKTGTCPISDSNDGNYITSCLNDRGGMTTTVQIIDKNVEHGMDMDRNHIYQTSNNVSTTLWPETSAPLDCFHGSGSLPTAEELKIENGISSSGRGRGHDRGHDHDSDRDRDESSSGYKKKWCCYYHGIKFSLSTIVIGLLIVLALMLVLIGIGQGIRHVRNSNSSTSDSSKTRKVDIYTAMKYFSSGYGIKFNGTDTPQHQAVQWLTEVDEANWELPELVLSSEDDIDANNYRYRYLARFLMALNYYAMNGDTWINKLQFLSSYDICQWIGYVQSTTNIQPSITNGNNNSYSINDDIKLAGVFCDPVTNIPNDISIFFNELSGTIPTENGLLTSLQVFDVKNNEIGGMIPTELCQLTQLTSLFFGFNNMHGQIPHCIGQLTNMLRIFWSNNNFHGILPPSMTKMGRLERLIIDDNLLTGNPIKIWNNMNRLEMIMADGNQLTGVINEDFLSNHPNLTVLDLSSNKFTIETKFTRSERTSNLLNYTSTGGSGVAYIPKHLFELDTLKVLDLSANNISAMFPLALDVDNDSLEFLSLFGNNLHGPIPSTINKLKRLVHLDVSDNDLTGPIPNEIGEMVNLTYLFLSNNVALEQGSVPTWISNLKQLTDLSLRRTNRNGTIPANLDSSMSSLVLIDLSSNSLSGTIPETWGQLSGLEFLLISNNVAISGEVPVSLLGATQLRAIFLDGTNIHGSLDNTLCTLPGFTDVDFDGMGTETMYANCLGETTQTGRKPIQCSCCRCCDAMSIYGCSNAYLGNLDASWERDFRRVSYTFTNDTYYWNSELFPNLV